MGVGKLRYRNVGRLFARARNSLAWPLCVTVAAVTVAITSGPAVAAQHPVPARSAPQSLRSSALAVPAVTHPAGGGASPSAAARRQVRPVKEIVADRTATTSTWQDSDGTLSVRRYLAQHFYRAGKSGWQPIDSRLAAMPGQAGWWQTTANNWQVAFGPAGAAGGAERLSVGGAQIGFAPVGVSDPSQAPVVSGSAATYRSLWPGVDLRDLVTSSGVKEVIVIDGPGSAATFAFRLQGATARANGTGGLDVFANGRAVGAIPPLTVATRVTRPAKSAGSLTVAPPDPARASGAAVTVAGDVVRVSVSPRWLSGLPSSAFPVVIDPTFEPPRQAPTQLVSVANDGTVLNGVMQNGLQLATGQKWRSAAYIPAPALPAGTPGAPPWQLVFGFFNAGCASSPCGGNAGLTGLTVYGEPNAASSVPTFSSMTFAQTIFADPPNAGEAAISADMTAFFRGKAGAWLGVVTNEAGIGLGTLVTFDPSQVYATFTYAQQPPATAITSPASGSVLATTTPTLTAAPVTTEQGAVDYDFVISTDPAGAGTVIDSGWLSGQASWTVPPGSLQDGVTYYAIVLDAITQQFNKSAPGYVPPATPLPPVSFRVKERLGGGGPSPTDSVGSPPGGTGTPSQGSPSSGAPTASETVDVATGNLAVQVRTHQVQALSGPVGISLVYNSASSSLSNGDNYGLVGQYFADGGSHAFTGSPAGQRTDPGVNATWLNGGPPIGGIPAFAPFMARWTGTLSLPAGTWEVGGITTGGMRVYLNGSGTPSYDDWAGAAGVMSPSFGSVTVSGGRQYQVEVDDWDPNQSGVAEVQLWATNTADSDPSTASVIVPSNWLTPAATGVPPGWSLAANAAMVQWSRAEDDGDQVILHALTGETATFTRTPDGFYQAQPGNHDYVTFDGTGHLRASTPDGYLYTFNPDGTLASMTTIADDRHPAALQYTYSGTPALLRAITDPVSGRSVTLAYGGDAACPAGNAAPGGMLCTVGYWDGTSTSFGYNGNGQLASVTDPGGVTTLLGYDGDNRLADIRDSLTVNYLAAGGLAGTAAACPAGTTGLSVTPVDTQVCYDGSGRVATVRQPSPAPGAARPARTYAYAGGHTDVSIAGFSPSPGYEQRVVYNAQDQVIQQVDSAGHASTTVWDPEDRPIVTADAAGEQTSTVYDLYGNVTDTYGPAPLGCFSGGWPVNVTPTAPVQGYLPVTNPQGTPACSQPVIPHMHSGYDENITGLAATYWANGQFAGAAAAHATGLGSTSTSASAAFCSAEGLTAASGLCVQWAAGAPPVSSDASGHWSLRLTGIITLPDTGGDGVADMVFGAVETQPVTMTIDGRLILHNGPDVNSSFQPGQLNDASSDDGGMGFSAGQHSIEVDFQGSASQLNEFSVNFVGIADNGAETPPQVIPNSMLGPAYFLKTSTTDPDGVRTTTSYSNAAIGPEFGLPTATTVGAGSSTPLTTTMTYEAPGAGSFLRRTSSALPSGSTTAYAYYAGTGGPVAAACGVSASTPQGGQLQATTSPAPAPGAAAREQQYVYDATGREVGVRTGTTATIGSQPWQCTSYDSQGRMASQAWPAFSGAPARTVTYAYSVGGNPLTSTATDSSGTITATVDLLGRVTSYTDARGQTTTTGYDQAGRTASITTPSGQLTTSYDPNTGQPVTTALNGTTMATSSYQASTGRLVGVSYADGTTATIGYDSSGAEDSLTFTSTATGALVAGNLITRSPGGRDTSELQDINGSMIDPNPDPNNPFANDYTYDGAGRLTSAYLPGGTLASYSYAPNPASDGCAAANAGADTNRTQVTITPSSGPAQTTDYCYNSADQLTGTVSGGTAGPGSYAYDGHGNQTTDGGTKLTWDAADRLASATTASGSTTSYAYDAVNRVTTRQTGSAATGYWYAGYTDSPAGTLNANGNITAAFIGLPCGVSVTVQPSGNTWSYPDLHGNYTVTTNNSGTRQGNPAAYDPWGQLLAGSQPVANAPGSSDLGAYGTSGKVTDTSSGIIIMSARAFSPAEARFLSVDPINGGCANAYTYAFGDPLNHPDLSGQGGCVKSGAVSGSCTLGAGVTLVGGILPIPHVHPSCTVYFSPSAVQNILIGGGIASAVAGAIASACTGTIVGAPCGAVAGIISGAIAALVGAIFGKAGAEGDGVQITVGTSGFKDEFIPPTPCKLS
jgi:RHS repeat-associated protein